MSTHSNQLEIITTARQTAAMLASDVQTAYKAACFANPLLAMLLLDLIDKSRGIESRLAEIEQVLAGEQKSATPVAVTDPHHSPSSEPSP